MASIHDIHPSRIFWHGTASGLLVGSTRGLHVGTRQAAKEALEAAIGIPAEGIWDGTREYGKTLLAGKRRLRQIPFSQSGYNCGDDVPEEDYYPTERTRRATFSDRTPVSFDYKPVMLQVAIVGEMTNSPHWRPMEDGKANSTMARFIKRGQARRGYYYTNIAEDAGSISAAVPSREHLVILPTNLPVH